MFDCFSSFPTPGKRGQRQAGAVVQDHQSEGLRSPPASPRGSQGSRAKPQPCEMLGLQLNNTAKTATLVLGFPLASSHVACPAPTMLRAALMAAASWPHAPQAEGLQPLPEARFPFSRGWGGRDLNSFSCPGHSSSHQRDCLSRCGVGPPARGSGTPHAQS